jgi:hypothetical protein
MKFQLTSLLVLTLLVSACGKDEKSSSSSSSKEPAKQPTTNKVEPVADNMTSTGTNAYSEVLSWYNSKTENSTPAGAVLEQRLISTYAKSNCETDTILGFINIQTCFGSSSTKSSYIYTNITAKSSTDKSQNSKLYLAFNPTSDMGLQGVTESKGPFGKSLYQIDYVKFNGHVVRYKIDTGLNSAFNPVEIYDSEAGTMESVVNATQLR